METETNISLPFEKDSLNRVRKVRNACAHNNCIINDLSPLMNTIKNKPKFRESRYITDFMANANINKPTMHKKLSNQRFSQIIHLIYVYSNFVKNGNTLTDRITELKQLCNNRMTQNYNFFDKNKLLLTSYDVLKMLIEKYI